MLPIIYQNNDFILYSYPLLMGMGWGVAYQIFFTLIPEYLKDLKSHLLFWGLFLSSWVGAKTLFLLTLPENEELISHVSFWTGGGFVFYGGFLGALLFCLFFHYAISRLSLKIIWPMIPALTWGHGIGRLGCFLAGCCFGKETDLWWGVFQHGAYRHPTQLLETILLILLGFYFLKSRQNHLALLIKYLCLYGAARMGIEGLRGDDIRGMWGPLSPSQWFSMVMIICGAIMSARLLKSRA